MHGMFESFEQGYTPLCGPVSLREGNNTEFVIQSVRKVAHIPFLSHSVRGNIFSAFGKGIFSLNPKHRLFYLMHRFQELGLIAPFMITPNLLR